MPLVRLTILAGFALTAIAYAVPAPPANAGDDFADWSCDALWEERNTIFKDAGYCFQSPRAIKKFGNADCEYDSESDVPLSDNQREEINNIKAAEKANGC